DGEARRAEAPDRLAADVLEHLLALPHGLSEPLRSLLCHATMVPPVGRDLVAGARDLPHDLRLPVGQPSEDEESAASAVPVEHLEEAPDTVGDTALHHSPEPAVEPRLEGRHLEVLLHVDREV